MAPKRTTRSTAATTTTTTTTPELALMCTRMFPKESDKNERAYTIGSGEKKPYEGSKILCSKCNYYHDGQCAPKYHKCNRVGHLAHDCRSIANANTANNQRGTRAGQKPMCYECRAHRHFKKECPKLKNNNCGNQGGNGNALAKVYTIGHAGTNPDSNVVTAKSVPLLVVSVMCGLLLAILQSHSTVLTLKYVMT
nr:hypothetical protein [Tanacetum cinerariifolium]